jgi:sigma-B regulation protein RsbU (phosphoserine phosphatase)
VNRILCGANLDAMYVTLFLGFLDTRTGRLRLANGGHPPGLRLDGRGLAIPFGGATGPILGILDRRTFGTDEVRLNPGDLAILHTDGVTEARRRDGAFFGVRRLSRVLEGLERRTPDEACHRIAASLREFERQHRHDDATVLGLARPPV